MTIAWVFEVDWDRDGNYSDESARLLQLSTLRGRDRAYSISGAEPMRVGELYAVMDNSNNRYDPLNPNGPLYGDILPGRKVRVSVVEGVNIQVVFSGFVQDIRPVGYRRVATMRAMDALYYLDRQPCTEVAQRSNYPVVQAFHDLIGLVALPGTDETAVFPATLPVRLVTGTPTTLADYSTFPATLPVRLGSSGINDNGDIIEVWDTDPDDSVLKALNMLAESRWGTLFVNKAGILVYRARDNVTASGVTLDQAYLLSELEQAAPWDDVFTELIIEPVNGNVQIESDSFALANFGRQQMKIASNRYIQSEEHSASLAAFLKPILSSLKRPLKVRLEDQFDLQFGLDLMDNVNVTATTLGISGIYQVGQVDHEWAAPGACMTTLRLEPDFYGEAGYQRLPATLPVTLGW